MPIPRFSTSAVVRATPEGLRATIDPGWGQGRATFGGLLTGLGLRALAIDRPLRSVLTSFVAPIPPGEVGITTRHLRDGRALTQAAAELVVGDQVGATILAAYGDRRETAVTLPGDPPPPAVPPGELVPFPYIEGVIPRFTRAFEFRWTHAAIPFTGGTDARVGGWVRFAAHEPVDAVGLVALLDAWPAPVLPLFHAPAPASTVTWMVNLVADVPPGGWPGDAWWRFEGETFAAGGGYADVYGRLWTADGALVATSHQLVAEFSTSR